MVRPRAAARGRARHCRAVDGAPAAIGPAGCSSSSSGPDGGTAEAPLTPVPAPEGLLATGFVPTPDATWARARAAIGGPSAFFPQSFGGLAATGLGLPITVAGEIDGDVPVLAALASPIPRRQAAHRRRDPT